MSLHKPIYQLTLNLDLPEIEPEDDAVNGYQTPQEAGLRLEQARQSFDMMGEKPEWYADYERLREGGWPFRVAMYIAWAASPRQGRQPDRLEGLASLMGLRSKRVIFTWRAKNPAIDEQVALMQAAPLFQHRADLFRASLDVALGADYTGYNDRKLLFEMLGDYVPRSQLEVGKRAKGMDDLSDEELEKMMGGEAGGKEQVAGSKWQAEWEEEEEDASGSDA